jgi:dihydropyrimidinase
MSFDLVIDNGTVVAPGAEPAPLAVGVRDGKIAAIGAHGTLTGGKDVVDAKGLHVFPGLVDPHIHVGFINKVDTDFESESASAATGGVCTVIPFYRHVAGDNPARAVDSGTVGTDNNYAESFPFIKAAGENHSHVDFSLHYAFTTEGHLSNLDSFLDLGVGSFKFYLAYKDDEAATYKFIGEGPNDGLLLDAMKAFGERGNVVACIHAENPEIYKRATKRVKESGRSDLHAWEESRPAICEAENVSRCYYFGEITGAPVYIVHMSSREALAVTRRAKLYNKKAYAETCPHYLTHNVDSELGGMLRVTPPVRTKDDNEALWAAVADGTIDTVGSDHTYRSRAIKQGNVWEAASAFPGTATILPVLLSEGHRKRGLSLTRIAEVTSKNPATIFGLGDRKGDIKVGLDADFAIVDLNWARTVEAAMLNSAADFSIYEGWTLTGWPRHTIVRGTRVMNDGKIIGAPGHGTFIPAVI